MTDTVATVLAQFAGQYKKGYRTSEFWVSLLVGLVQTLAAAFNPNQTLKAQLSNLTWVGISYILARSGLKTARIVSAGRVISSVAQAGAQPAGVAVPEALSMSASAPAGRGYGWPLKPFDRMHPVRAYLNDPRIADGSQAFHFGIDISAPDGTPVFAVEGGTVYLEGAQNVAVVTTDRSREFGYWHLVPAVTHHQVVRQGDLLGHIAKSWGHVHFAERSGDYLNPIRPGALTPFSDPHPPVVSRIVCSRGGQELDPRNLHGPLDVIVEAFDHPPLPVPSPWAGMPVSPARISWAVLRGNQAIWPWHTPIELGAKMLPQQLFPVVYAPGTRANHPSAPGLFRYVVAHTWSSRLIPDGNYQIVAEVSDLHGNKTRASQPITLANHAKPL
jgi:murein DD-endopeptidase MepM/ murein hydrolase activator NlpD